MIARIIRVQLGSVGRYFADLYREYSLIVNAIVLIWAGFVIWTHIRFQREVQQLEREMIEYWGTTRGELERTEAFSAFLRDWKARNASTRFLVPHHLDLWWQHVDAHTFAELVGLNEEYFEAVLYGNHVVGSLETISLHDYHRIFRQRAGLLRGFLWPRRLRSARQSAGRYNGG